MRGSYDKKMTWIEYIFSTYYIDKRYILNKKFAFFIESIEYRPTVGFIINTQIRIMKKNTKQNIITIARAVFLEHGYEQTSLQMIIEKSGISKGGLYHYFSSKEEILEETIKEEFASLFKDLAIIFQDPDLGYKDKILQVMEKKKVFYIERYEVVSHVFLSEEHLLLQYKAKMIISPLFDPYIEQLFHEAQWHISIETLRILFWVHEMLFESALPYVHTISEFEKYMDIVDNMIHSLIQ